LDSPVGPRFHMTTPAARRGPRFVGHGMPFDHACHATPHVAIDVVFGRPDLTSSQMFRGPHRLKQEVVCDELKLLISDVRGGHAAWLLDIHIGQPVVLVHDDAYSGANETRENRIPESGRQWSSIDGHDIEVETSGEQHLAYRKVGERFRDGSMKPSEGRSPRSIHRSRGTSHGR
jgi:hypothetical protein